MIVLDIYTIYMVVTGIHLFVVLLCASDKLQQSGYCTFWFCPMIATFRDCLNVDMDGNNKWKKWQKKIEELVTVRDFSSASALK